VKKRRRKEDIKKEVKRKIRIRRKLMKMWERRGKEKKM
jgi:hypothetical protein